MTSPEYPNTDPNAPSPQSWRLKFLIFFFLLLITSAGLGPLLTAWGPLTSNNWQLMVLLRVLPLFLACLALAVFFAVIACRQLKSRLLVIAGFLGFFLALSLNPVLDLCHGLQRSEGVFSSLDYERETVSGDHKHRSYTTYKPIITLLMADQSSQQIRAGTANWLELGPVIRACGRNAEMRLTYLVHLQRILEFECLKPGRPIL